MFCVAGKRKDARTRTKQRKKDNERGLGSADLAEMAQDDDLLATEPGDKPEPPGDFDEAAVMKEVGRVGWASDSES